MCGRPWRSRVFTDTASRLSTADEEKGVAARSAPVLADTRCLEAAALRSQPFGVLIAEDGPTARRLCNYDFQRLLREDGRFRKPSPKLFTTTHTKF